MSVLAYAASRAVCSLERLLTLNLATKGDRPSPVQVAICRIVDGTPLGALGTHPLVIDAMGGPAAMATLSAMRAASTHIEQILLLAGVRCGKSLLTALAAIRASQVVDTRRLGPGEFPRVSVVSLTKDNATATFSHILGTIEAVPAVRALVVGTPTADSVFLRHPSGRKVEIVVAAGAKAAGSLVSRWFAGVIFDEAPRMDGVDEAVVNLDDQLRNLPMRMLPGAHIFMIGSPWAPFGPVFNRVDKHWRRPTPGMLVIRARASWMNPVAFTPEVIEKLRVENPDTYLTDEEGEFMSPEAGLVSPTQLDACLRADEEDLPPVPRYRYAAAMDPATRGNDWTLMVGTFDGQRWSVVMVRRWQGSSAEPLSPKRVLGEMAALLRPYNVDVIVTDQHGTDGFRDIARDDFGLTLIEEWLTGPVKVNLFTNLKTYLTELCVDEKGVPDGRRRMDLPRNMLLRKDILGIRRKTTQASVSIDMPLTADGRHGDFAIALALLLIHPLSPPIPEPETYDDDEWHKRQLKAEIAARLKKRDRALRFG